MEKQNFTFRKLTFPEFEILVDWAIKEGWNPGLEDASVFWATDPDAFYGYFEKETMIGGGSIVSYSGQMGFMGFFIVRPDYRAKGLGTELWFLRRNTLLSRLQPNAPIAMDGILAMQPFYQKGGFVIDYSDERYVKTGSYYPPNPSVQPSTANDFEAIVALDKECFGVARPHFYKLWLDATQTKSFSYIENGVLLGVAVIRPAQTGFRIGPLYAENETVATALYERCLSEAIDQPVCLDIPMSNKAVVNLVKKYQATFVFECARMYYGTPPKTNINKVFGLTTFEIG